MKAWRARLEANKAFNQKKEAEIRRVYNRIKHEVKEGYYLCYVEIDNFFTPYIVEKLTKDGYEINRFNDMITRAGLEISWNVADRESRGT